MAHRPPQAARARLGAGRVGAGWLGARRLGARRLGARIGALLAALALAGGALAAPAGASGSATTTTLVSLSGSPVPYGGDITLTVQVTSSGAAVPAGAGTVSFTDADGGFGTPCASVAVDSSGQASCTSGAIDGAPGSNDTVHATFTPGSGAFEGSSMSPLSVPVVIAPTITSLSTAPVSVGGGEQLSALVESDTGAPVPDGSTVTFSDQGGAVGAGCADVVLESGSGSCSAGPFLHAGADTVSATFNGSTDLASSSTSVQVDVSPGATAIAVAPASGAVGSTATISATVSPVPDGGDVAFSDGAGLVACDSAVDGSGRATCTSAVLMATGTDTVTAQFLGNTDYSASPQATGTLTIGPGPTTVSLQASPSSPSVGGTATITATVSGPPGTGAVSGGTVSFSDAAGAISDCGSVSVVAATASCTTLAFAHAGSDAVSASYSGSGVDAASGPWTLPVQVQPEQPTITAVASPQSPAYGQQVVLTATISPPPDGGTVAFSDQLGDVSGCAQVPVGSGGVATCTSQPLGAVGSDQVTATYSGDADFSGAFSGFTLHISPSPAQLSLSFSPSPATAGAPFTVSATVAPTPASGSAGTVSFSDSDGTLSGCGAVLASRGQASCTSADLPAAGTDTVHAVFSGDADLASTSAQGSLAVDQAPTTLELTTSAHDLIVGSGTATLTATVSPPPPAGAAPAGDDLVEFSIGGLALSGCNALAVSSADPSASCTVGPFAALGPLDVTVAFSGDTVDAPASAPASLQIVPVSTSATLDLLGTPLHYGAVLHLVAAVTPAPDGGSVAFSDADGAVSGCAAVPLSGGQATCRIASIGISGPDTFDAAFSGTTDYRASAASVIAPVDRPPSLLTTTATVTTGEDAHLVLAALGYPLPTFTLQSALPAGLSLSAAGVLSGVPVDGEGGLYPVTVQLTGGSATATATLQLEVDQAPVLSAALSSTFTAGTPGDLVVSPAPGAYPPPTYAERGALPAGVTFAVGSDDLAVISGTPAAGSVGTYTLVVAASNAAGAAPPLTIVLRVAAPPPPPPEPPSPPISVTAPAPPRASGPLSLAEVVAGARRESLPAPAHRLALGRAAGPLPAEVDLTAGPGGAAGPGRAGAAGDARTAKRASAVALGALAGFPSLGNVGTFGDCSVVAVSSVVRADHDAGRFPVVPAMTTAEAVAAWHRLNGGSSAGVTDAELLAAWESSRGLLGTRLTAWHRLAVTDRVQLERAVLATGALYAVLVVPAQADQLAASDVWRRPTPAGVELGGHAVAVVGWTPRGVLVVTWGRLVLVSWSWWEAHAAAAFAVRPALLGARRHATGAARRGRAGRAALLLATSGLRRRAPSEPGGRNVGRRDGL